MTIQILFAYLSEKKADCEPDDECRAFNGLGRMSQSVDIVVGLSA